MSVGNARCNDEDLSAHRMDNNLNFDDISREDCMRIMRKK